MKIILVIIFIIFITPIPDLIAVSFLKKEYGIGRTKNLVNNFIKKES